MAPFRLNRQFFNPALYSRLHEVWFEGLPDNATVAPPELMKRWFAVGATAGEKAQFDNVCTSSFQDALESISPAAYPLPPPPGSSETERQQAEAIASPFLAEVSALDTDAAKATAALGLILLLDQMPRNIFRTKQALIYSHYDRLARAVLHSLLRQTSRPDLDPSVRHSLAKRQWFYLPLMHSERLEDHALYSELSAAFRQDLAENGNEEATKMMDLNADFEKRHVVLIEKFGRYPHRNDHLERESTAEERAFLAAGGDSFGTG
ncbi:DUF924-domain-containing protein [Thozetella sp. PMI_491]|nr:DUF924-domain-containing protein [Thozetella sp. PMI_491]